MLVANSLACEVIISNSSGFKIEIITIILVSNQSTNFDACALSSYLVLSILD